MFKGWLSLSLQNALLVFGLLPIMAIFFYVIVYPTIEGPGKAVESGKMVVAGLLENGISGRTPTPIIVSPTPPGFTADTWSSGPVSTATAKSNGTPSRGSAAPTPAPSAKAANTPTATSGTPNLSASTLWLPLSSSDTPTPAKTATPLPLSTASATPTPAITIVSVQTATRTPIPQATSTATPRATLTPVNTATAVPTTTARTLPVAKTTATPVATPTPNRARVTVSGTEVHVFVNDVKVALQSTSITGEQLLRVASFTGRQWDLFRLQGEGDPTGGILIRWNETIAVKNGDHFRVAAGNRTFAS